jgi:PAS domain S-box-containing protein
MHEAMDLDAIFEQAPFGIAVFDRELRWVRVNPAIEAMTGRTRDSFVGRTLVEVYGDGARVIENVMRDVLVNGVPRTGVRIAGGGRGFTHDVHPHRAGDGSIAGVVCYCREITEQLHNERELVAELTSSRVQLEEAQSIAQIGSWEADLTTWAVTWSREARRLFAVGPDEVPSFELFLERVHPADRATVAAVGNRCVETAMPADFECRLQLPSGEIRTIAARNRPIVDDAGRVVRLIGTTQDVTDRRELERRLAVQDRMSSLGSLAAGLAHEINNPLAFVLGNTDLALDLVGTLRSALDTLAVADGARALMQDMLAQLAELVADSREGGARVRAIVRDMKTFARGDDSTQHASVDLRAIAVSTANLAANEIRHRARLVRELGDVPLVQGTDSRLGEVVLNLLINAAQAIPEGGRIEDHEVRLVTRTDRAGNAVLEVRDTGCGIPPANLRRIFDPFFTTKPAGSGTGLGLAICQSIVESLGGELSVESAVGTGSTFRVVLPPTVARGRDSVREVVVPSTRRGRVLIIDDEPMVLAFTGRCLAKEHDVTSLTDAGDALLRIDAGERFDVILCDLMMPKMNGIDFFEKLAARRRDVVERIVFMTGGTFTPRAQGFLDSVANLCLEKPFEPRRLRALVRDRVG